MNSQSLKQFNGKRVLLLQGPIGPFFQRLSEDLQSVGAIVFKINFNGGDWLFYRKSAFNFNKRLNDWPTFFEAFIQKHRVDTVMLFGDCRKIHQVAHKIANQHDLEIGVFEEGYIRPDYITLERYGVNANSQISKDPDFYATLPEIAKKHAFPIDKPFWYAALWGMLYNAASVIARPYFMHYQHHRPLSIWQGLFWIRSLWRKWLFMYLQKDKLNTIITEYDKKYFLVALQVHNDAQLHHHSDFYSIEAFISEVINSFAIHAPRDCHLVIKHHPMDRGFNHYGKLIDLICQEQVLKNRIHYVHDLHLPTLLNHTKGVVVINSTVGLSAILHGCPVIVCGNAIYDIEGLTYQGGLTNFWNCAASFNLDTNLAQKYANHLINISQINGNFYKRIEHLNYRSGLYWSNSDD